MIFRFILSSPWTVNFSASFQGWILQYKSERIVTMTVCSRTKWCFVVRKTNQLITILDILSVSLFLSLCVFPFLSLFMSLSLSLSSGSKDLSKGPWVMIACDIFVFIYLYILCNCFSKICVLNWTLSLSLTLSRFNSMSFSINFTLCVHCPTLLFSLSSSNSFVVYLNNILYPHFLLYSLGKAWL